MTNADRLLCAGTLLAFLTAAGLVVGDDYGDGYADGTSSMCLQLTEQVGQVHNGTCEVEVDGVWHRPVLEIRVDGEVRP